MRLPNDRLLDSWVVDDGDLYHLFFLKAQPALKDAGRRHPWNRLHPEPVTSDD